MSDLDSVLEALKKSRKLQHWDKPPREFGPNNPEDSDYNRNGLKDVGDLSKISFSSCFSFGDEENKEEGKTDNAWPDTSSELESRLEDPVETHKPLGNDSLEVAELARKQYRLTLMMKALALEEECQRKVKESSKVWHEAYLNKLNKIHAASENDWAEYIHREYDKLAHEEIHLREQTRAAQEAVIECQSKYSQHIAECSSFLMDAFERAQRQEVEEANIRRLHLNNLQGLYSNFVSHVAQMQELYKELEGSETLDPGTESLINQTVTKVEEVINTGHHGTATEEQLVKAQAALDQSFTSVKEITQSLHVKKEEKGKLEQEKAAQEAEANKAKSELVIQNDTSEAPEQESQENISQEKNISDFVIDGKDRFAELKERMKAFLNAKQELTSARMLKLMSLAKPVNQLNVNDQFINRDRLQQIMGAFAGREIEPGKGSVITPTELLYLKNHVTKNVVKQGIGHDRPTTAVYSWFIVNLVASHPDMCDLFTYHLFNECQGLVLVPQKYSADQSVDLLHQIMGRRDKEREDQFAGRNGKCAFMYGMVLAMLYKKKKESSEMAPVKGWQLMAKILSAPPISCVTGEIILEFLTAFGFVLQQTYGKQFLKLMTYLSKVYLPQIDKAKGAAGNQCFAMLQVFLSNFEKLGTIQQDPLIDKYKC